MTHPHTEADVRSLLERRLGHAVDEVIWAYLAEERYPSLVVEEDATVEELAEQYRRLEQVRAGPSADGTALRRPPREPQHIEPDDRLEALSRRLAQLAAEEPLVVAFRAEVLGGQLLAPKAVAAWIGRQAEADGEPTLYLGDVALPPGHTFEQRREGIWATPALTLSKEAPARRVEFHHLAYEVPGKGGVDKVPVAHGGTLDRLRRLSEELARTYRWQEAKASLFILTGEVPLRPRAVITWEQYLFWPGPDGRIKLDLDPTLGPAEVAKIYRSARNQFPLTRPSRRYRPMTKKHARLAEWAGKKGTWRDHMEEWNRACPEDHADWRYRDPRNFARDVTHAARRLFGL